MATTKKVKISKIIEYCKKAVGCPYWYGCFGQISTEKLYNSKKEQYPKYYTWALRKSQLKKRVFDCIGLFKGALWTDGDFNKNPKYNPAQDVSADEMYKKCSKRGTIKTFKKQAGTFVFKNGHIGLYIGNNKVIEAKGHEWGVIYSNFDAGKWTKWGLCPEWIEYDLTDEKKENKPASKPTEANKPAETKTAKYYKRCNAKYYSIVDALNSVGVNSSFAHRKKIAKANGIKNYIGTSKQNVKLLNLLKNGKLKKA